MNLKQWHIDWLAARDLPQTLEIESESFGQFAWSEKDFRGALQCKNVIGISARPHADATYICGFAIYALLPSRIEILNLAVGWQWRRNGFGAALLQRIKDRLSFTRRRKIKATARDSNIESHLFLAAQGFTAVEVIREPFNFCSDDAYVFEFRVGSTIGRQTKGVADEA